jgi:hypothetical protein
MKLRHSLAVLAATAVIPFGAPFAQAATLSDLVAGGTLVEHDLVFDGFFFDDRFGDDETGGRTDTQDPSFPGDRSVDASEIEITTSRAGSTVSLTATIAPSIFIQDGSRVAPRLFEFLLEFNVSVAGASSREIAAVTLGGGDLFATGTGVSEAIFDIVGFGPGLTDLEIFEAPGFGLSQASDRETVPLTSLLQLAGTVEGDTNADGDTAGLSTFSFTFDLAGTPPPPLDGVVPVPPALPLFLTAMAGLGLLRHVRRT